MKSDTSIRRQVKMILALSFVKIDDMDYYANKLEEYIVQHKSSSVLTLFSWFKQEYLHNDSANKTLEFCNVKKRTDCNISRTTNSLKRYHRHLNNLIITEQNSIVSILNELKDEQTITENKIFWSLYRDPVIKHDLVKKILEKYSTYDAVDYLIHIALNFNWKLD
ncbi:hypothetical protein EQH57_0483 [Dictyocoela roeselum]|nr:hypothetical protein EQH57_0483 [Dictyocoela roeselum]